MSSSAHLFARTLHAGDQARPRPQRVAVFRALQLGDLLCAVPAFRALRHNLPRAHITLIGLPWAADFARRFSHHIDAFLEFPGYPGLSERAPDVVALPQFIAEAQARRFDLVIQMHGSGEVTNPLAVLLGGRATAGFYRPGQYCPDPVRFLPYPDAEPELLRHLDLLQHLGVPSRGDYLEFPLEAADVEAATRAAGAPLVRGRYAIVHPGSRAADRRWPPEAFARVADRIAGSGLAIVLTGTRDEAPLTNAVARLMRAEAVDMAGRTPLGGLAALLNDARLLVSNDTGVSHIADALSVPSVVVFTGSDPVRWAPLDRVRHRVIDARRADGTAASDQVKRAIAEAGDLLRTEGSHAAGEQCEVAI